MKVLAIIVILSLLPTGLSVAQTPARSSVRPPATRPAATEGQPAPTTNRQQELYDQYHGVNKKTTTPTTTAAPATSRIESQPTAAATRPEQPSSAGSRSGVRIGLRGGVTYLVYTEKVTGVDPAIGFVGGLTFNFGAGTLSFQPEINYARYGVKSSFLGTNVTAASDQINVPLFLKIASGTYDGTRFFLNVGPYGAYVASASVNGKKFTLNGSEGRISYGAAAGIGAALKAGPGHLTIEVRGYYQLGDNNKPSDGTSTTIPAQATLGYMFPLGGR